MKLICGLIIMFLLMMMPRAYLQGALYIDDTSTTDKNHFYMEFTFDYYKDVEKEFDPDSEEYTKAVSKETDLTSCIYYGLTDSWEVGISVPYMFLDDSSTGRVNGFSDISIDTKYRFWEEGKMLPSYAFYFGLKTNSANDDKGLGTGKKDYTINNIFTKSIRDYALDLNLGYTFFEVEADDIFFYSFGIYRDLTERIGIYSDIYGETAFSGNFDDNIFCLGLSLEYEVNKTICLESGIGIGISQSSPDYQVSTTLSFSF